MSEQSERALLLKRIMVDFEQRGKSLLAFADALPDLPLAELETLSACRVEPSLADAAPGSRCQFERLGYFCVDPDSREGTLVFNRTVPLRDSWAKIERAQKAGKR